MLWLVPLVSIGDVLWALSTRMGMAITFGMGLYKWDMIHLIIQVSLAVLLSLLFVASGSSGETALVVEAEDEQGAGGPE